MLLKNNLDTRIAEVIRSRISEERAYFDTSSPQWREQCEAADAATRTERERGVLLSHITETRGHATAERISRNAEAYRTSAIFFLARKPS
ncbi:DUF7696 family protein (plasmid) [Robbsia andropogonis]|uniref:DUF7696 family protein n=1 Tax=Robbsia andropogonis TaxID=28092 RepID=UPI002A6B452A|nr:hypothetical protein [Robbsia andropogonis]